MLKAVTQYSAYSAKRAHSPNQSDYVTPCNSQGGGCVAVSADLLSLLSWEMMEWSPLFMVLQGQRDRGGLAASPHSTQHKAPCVSACLNRKGCLFTQECGREKNASPKKRNGVKAHSTHTHTADLTGVCVKS